MHLLHINAHGYSKGLLTKQLLQYNRSGSPTIFKHLAIYVVVAMLIAILYHNIIVVAIVIPLAAHDP